VGVGARGEQHDQFEVCDHQMRPARTTSNQDGRPATPSGGVHGGTACVRAWPVHRQAVVGEELGAAVEARQGQRGHP